MKLDITSFLSAGEDERKESAEVCRLSFMWYLQWYGAMNCRFVVVLLHCVASYNESNVNPRFHFLPEMALFPKSQKFFLKKNPNSGIPGTLILPQLAGRSWELASRWKKTKKKKRVKKRRCNQASSGLGCRLFHLAPSLAMLPHSFQRH